MINTDLPTILYRFRAVPDLCLRGNCAKLLRGDWRPCMLLFVKQQYVFQMSPQYGELRPTSGWDQFWSLGHPYEFQRVSRLSSVTARYSSSAQPNFAALNRGRYLYWAGRPSRWAFAHIVVALWFRKVFFFSARVVNTWNNLSNSVVDACTANGCKTGLDKF